MGFVAFMGRTAGRVARAGAGVVLIVAGVLTGGVGGWILALVGLVPLAAAASNVCLLAPLFHAPLRGRA